MVVLGHGGCVGGWVTPYEGGEVWGVWDRHRGQAPAGLVSGHHTLLPSMPHHPTINTTPTACEQQAVKHTKCSKVVGMGLGASASAPILRRRQLVRYTTPSCLPPLGQ